MGMASRPGSALSMHNNTGGNGETSLTLEFSGLGSVSGHDPHHHHHHDHDHDDDHEHSNGNNHSNNNSNSSTSSSATTFILGSAEGLTRSVSAGKGSKSSGGGAGASTAGMDYKRKRKRREMQPVNTIVESAEPHVDDFLWKNNGNTIQKKTGCKSIYYKCSNSNSGCTVGSLTMVDLMTFPTDRLTRGGKGKRGIKGRTLCNSVQKVCY